MGHLGHLKEEYRDLVRRLAAGPVSLPEPDDEKARQGFREILEIMYTPEEAALASRMPVAPSDLATLSAKLGIPEGELRPKLDAMCDKGVVMDLVSRRSGKTRYLLSPPVVGFFEFSMMRAKDSIPKKRMAEAIDAYTHGDPAFAKEVFGGETVIGRALMHETAIEDVPEVLDFEKATAIVSKARSHAVSLCYCRHEAEHLGRACDAPQEVCLSLDAGADFVIRRGFGRAVSADEAMRLMVESRKAGLVQICDNVLDQPTYVCNCCGCCCGQLQSINQWGLAGVNPSAFLARSDSAHCNGCSKCARACPIAAIHMEPHRLEAKRKGEMRSVVDEEKCIGCGVCVDVCKKDAMHAVRRSERPHVPKNSIERVLRMTLERGHLGDMLFEEGSARGVGFLGQALRAMLALPPAQRLLASEQVSSRFVKAALARVKEPTA
jgi:ferredoxin